MFALPTRFALRRCARTLPLLAAVTTALLLGSGGPAVTQDQPHDRAGRDADATVLQRRRQFALKQLDVIESELLEVQAQLRKGRIAILLAKEMQREKHAEAVEEAMRNDAEATRLRKAIDQANRDIAVFKERSPQPQREPGYLRALQELQAAREKLVKRGDMLLQQVLEKTPLDDLLGKERAAHLRVDHLRKAEEFLIAEWENRVKVIAALR